MRIVFNTELKIEVDANNDALRAAFIKLITQAAEQVYGTAAMLSKAKPTIIVSQVSREGKTQVPLFGARTEPEESEQHSPM